MSALAQISALPTFLTQFQGKEYTAPNVCYYAALVKHTSQTTKFCQRHQPVRLPYPSPFYFQVKVWDCNTGKCTETLKVRSVAEANKGAVEGLLGRPAPPEPNIMLLAGGSERGPCLCLYARRETLSVWSC